MKENLYSFKALFFAFLFLFSFPLFAQSDEDETKYYPQIIIVEDDEEASELESKGVLIWHRRADMALALIPYDLLESSSAAPSRVKKTKRFREVRKAIPALDIAKTYFDASKIQSGEGLSRPYTGKGVVVGFCDVGFDPNHINFIDEAGNPRVRKLVSYQEQSGRRTILETPEEIKAWTSDTDRDTHATHVAGILAGSYSANNYHGMAPDAEIVATTSQLTEVGMLAGCEEILSYARSVGKPAVINLSVGSYNGPHDGTSLFNRYMALIGREAIVCLSSGNEGLANGSYGITFSQMNPEWYVRINSADYIQYKMRGVTDVWSADSRPVDFQFVIFDENTRQSVYESQVLNSTSESVFAISSETDEEFAKYFTGDVEVYYGVSDLNGRWYAEMYYVTQTEETSSVGPWARYNLGIKISGEVGVHADVTSDQGYSHLAAWPGYGVPNSNLSVSDLATGDNVICVGMYNSRNSRPMIDGTTTGWFPTYTPGKITDRSSYGTLIDGRVLPHTVAPGFGLVSSTNKAFLEANPSSVSSEAAKVEKDGKTYYYHIDGGTSMSSPYTAGTIATWLEANPRLTVDDVKAVLLKTNLRQYDTSNPRSGQGWLNPYEGLKEVILNTSVAGIADDTVAPAIVLKGDMMEILNPSKSALEISVVTVSGVRTFSRHISGEGAVSIDISSLAPGFYVVSAVPQTGSPARLKFRR